MSEQHDTDWLKQSKIFIWQGGWKGGAETITLEIARFLQEIYHITPTLGVFEGNKDLKQPFPQIEVRSIFPKHLVAYNNIAASWMLRKQVDAFDLVLTHTAGFWKTKHNHYIYREPGDLFKLFKALPLKSKIGYCIPLLCALMSLHTSDHPIAASRKAESFFRRVGVHSFLTSTNFLDTNSLPPITLHTYTLNKPFQLVFIGRDDKIKNLKWLERTLPHIIKSQNIHLHIFGIKKSNTKYITYHGWVTEQTIQNFLQQEAHALVLPSLFEASPLVLLQALAAGVPCLVKTSALPTELASDVLSFDNASSLETSLKTLIDTYAQRAESTQLRAAFIRNQYNRNTVLINEFEAIASRILAKHPQDQKKQRGNV